MSEVHERFTNGVFEAGWQPGVQSEFHRGENNQSSQAEEKRSEADKTKQIVKTERGKLVHLFHFSNVEDAALWISTIDKSVVGHACAVDPERKLLKYAQEKGWEVMIK